jgi:hypothetical protein
MNSFDVFDTLLARRHITSDPIWHQMEQELEAPGFVQARKAADTGSRNLYEIYDILVAQAIIRPEQRNSSIKREIELEIDVCFPVQKNLDRVAHGDILISDMYLPASAILQLVRSVGLDKQVTLYQSNGDKSQGTVWPKFGGSHAGIHLGDNRRSDYETPTAAGIRGEWFSPATEFTYLEQELFKKLANVALLSRESRLRTNAGQYEEYFNLAVDANLPLLFVLAEMLYRQYKGRNLVFLGRDCQLLHKIYSEYFEVGYYLPFSRKVAYDQSIDAVKYLHTHAPEYPIFVDISSTGGTWSTLNTDIDVVVAIYSDVAYYTATKPALPPNFKYLTTNSQIGQTNLLLEVMNCGDHGHLNSIYNYRDNLFKANFAEPELPADLIKLLHKPASDAVALSAIYKDAIRHELDATSDEDLVTLFGQLANVICSQQVLLEQLKEFTEKETAYLGQFTDE